MLLNVTLKTEALRLPGSYRTPCGEEHPLETVRLSIASIDVETDGPGAPGDCVLCRIDRLGSLIGRISHVHGGGFSFVIVKSAEDRARLASQILTLSAEMAGSDKRRRLLRIQLNNPRTTLHADGAQEIRAIVQECSMSGASITTNARPRIGSVIVVGETPARVVRHTDQGIAVAFLTPFAEEQLSPNMTL